MAENLIEKLRAKGWTPDEIAQALRVMAEAQTEKTSLVRFTDRLVYWVLLFVILVGNFFVSIITIPFIVFAPTLYLYPMLFLVSGTFGALYDLILYDINKIEGARQFMPQVLLPALALINIYMSMTLAGTLAVNLGLKTIEHGQFMIPFVYVLGFIAPFWYTRRTKFWEKVFRR